MEADNIIQPYYQKMRRRKKQRADAEEEVSPPVEVTGVAKVRDVLKSKQRTA